MNALLPDSHPSIFYYDSDYPSRDLSEFPENFDDTVVLQGLAHDVDRYIDLARQSGGEVLELCCGSGRVAIPLARAGFEVTAVDVSRGMLDLLESRIAQEALDTRARVRVVEADVTTLQLDKRDFSLAIMPFNSLLCITDFKAQRAAVDVAARHLAPGGTLALDLVNPLVLPLGGDPAPRPFFTRTNVHTGNRYTRFAAMGPIQDDQRQRLHGWYDEIERNGVVRRTEYSMEWRPIFRYEAHLIVESAGLDLLAVEGGHRGEPFTAASRKMFVLARQPQRSELRKVG